MSRTFSALFEVVRKHPKPTAAVLAALALFTAAKLSPPHSSKSPAPTGPPGLPTSLDPEIAGFDEQFGPCLGDGPYSRTRGTKPSSIGVHHTSDGNTLFAVSPTDPSATPLELARHPDGSYTARDPFTTSMMAHLGCTAAMGATTNQQAK